jgi:NAD+ kinase
VDIRNVGIVANARKPGCASIIQRVIETGARLGISVRVVASVAEELELDADTVAHQDLSESCDLIIAIGGDGTILNAARLVSTAPRPILGVNLGTLGFLAELSPDDVETGLNEIAQGHFSIERRMTLEATIVETGETVRALNDVLITKSSQSRIISLEMHEADRWVNTYVADGLIIATPTGSTAYALAAGGPIIEPSVDAMVAAPICPHALTVRPMVFTGAVTLDVRVHGNPDSRIELSGDAQQFREVMSGQTVRIERSAHDAQLLHLRSASSYYDILRQKLHWGMDKAIQ